MSVYGYARCSTNESRQDIDRQKRELMALGVPDEQHIYWEYAHGTTKDREQLNSLFSVVAAGDTIVSTEVSRLTRSTQHLCSIIELIQKQKLRLVIGSFVVDCRSEEIDAMTKGMLLMWGVFGEMERDITSQRVKSGVANARAKGKVIGRPKLKPENIPKEFWRAYYLYNSGEISITDMANLMNCSRTTVYSYMKIVNQSKTV